MQHFIVRAPAKPMRIAYICADAGVPVFGHKGCSIHVQEFLRALLKRGAEVTLYAARLGGVAPREFASLPIRQIEANRGSDAGARELAAFAANRDLLKNLRQDGPFDIIYERYSLFSYGAMQYARAIGASGILEINAPLIEEQSEYRTLVNRPLAEGTSRAAFAAASTLVAVSEEVARYLARYPETVGRVNVVPNGVDLDRFAPCASRVTSRSGTFTVGFVGSLKRWHGLSGLVAAFDSLRQRGPEARLLIVGDGPERGALEQDLQNRGAAGSAHFTGAVPHDEVPGLLASMDVAVAPYPKLSSFYFSPLKIYEYMAAGIPIVASRTGQVQQIVKHGVTGLLYEPDDIPGLCNALGLLRRDPQLRRQLGKAGRAWVMRGHGWDAVLERALETAGSNAQSTSVRAG